MRAFATALLACLLAACASAPEVRAPISVVASTPPPVRVGIGVHSGDVYCGLVGDDTRLEFTVLGDTVNVAARLEQATKRFDVTLLASQPVVEAAGEEGLWRFVTDEPLRGSSNALAILAPAALDVWLREPRGG